MFSVSQKEKSFSAIRYIWIFAMKNDVNECKFASSAILARICFLPKQNCAYGQIIIVMRFCISLIVYCESEIPFLDFCAILQCVSAICSAIRIT